MRFFKNNLGWILLVILFIALTPFIFHLAYLERGYRAIGGEIFFPLIPFIIWAIVKTAKRLKIIPFQKEGSETQ